MQFCIWVWPFFVALYFLVGIYSVLLYLCGNSADLYVLFTLFCMHFLVDLRICIANKVKVNMLLHNVAV